MIAAAPLQSAQYRLARHYLNKLRSADEAVRRGQASVSYGRSLFAQEWEQIKRWQAWAAQRGNEDEISAQLCKDFPLAGLEVLAIHSSSVDYALWLECGMEAAQRLDDREAERALCYELSMICYRLGSIEKGEHLARELLTLGEAAKDDLSIERAVLLLGVFAVERGGYAEAEVYYQRALQLSLELGMDTEISQALNGLGTIADYLGDYQKAHHYFFRQLELMETTGKKNRVCHALLMMGHALMGLKDYASAENYLQRAVNMGRAFGFQRLLGVGLFHLGSVALEQNQLEIAYRYFEDGMQAVRSVGIVRQIMSGLADQGYTLLRMGNYPAAVARLQEGLKMARESGRPRNLCELQSHLANTYLALNDLDSARCALREALTLAQTMESRPQKVEAISIAAAYYQRLGQNEQAALWLGTIMGDPELDAALMEPVCIQLEAVLGSVPYQSAIVQGRSLKLDEIVPEIILLLSR